LNYVYIVVFNFSRAGLSQSAALFPVVYCYKNIMWVYRIS